MRHIRSSQGQALPLAIAIAGVLVALALGLFQLGRAHLAVAQAQTAADLAALAVAADVESDSSVSRALAAEVASASGAQLERVETDRDGAVRVVVRHPGPLGLVVRAQARAGAYARRARRATGGGYAGPLVLRDGKPTCPAVAAAFDRMDAAAREDGVDLVVTSGYRSDAEQAELFRRRPDPRWVAPPGRSRHRDATELDISGAGRAWSWLASNGPTFGFVQRYSWEPWHWGFVAGCHRGGGSTVTGDEGLAPATAKPEVALLHP